MPVSQPRPGLIYGLGQSLYISLTNRSPVTSLIHSRGPNFPFAGTFRWLDVTSILDEPRSEEVLLAMKFASAKFPDWDKESIVFAGGGEPLLKQNELIIVANALGKNGEGYNLRLNTCGLFAPGIVKQLKSVGISHVSIALNGHDADSYHKIMNPNNELGFADVILFMTECIEQGLFVEASCINRNDIIDLAKVRNVAENLGVTFRLRKYFP